MPKTSYSDDQLILASRLYYLDGLSQSHVAKLVNVSQSKVSRMLGLAQAKGIVRISVADYVPRAIGIEGELRKELGIESVVIRTPKGLPSTESRQMIGYFASSAVGEWMEGAEGVAIAGGRTIQSLVEHCKPVARDRPIEMIQAMGTIDASPNPYDAVELGRGLARRLNGTFTRLNAPAILPDAETCSQLLRLDQIQAVMGRLARADLALVGVGTLENSVFVEQRVLLPDDLAALRAAGAVGEMLGRFYDECGVECATPMRDRVVSLGLPTLKTIARRIGVVSGVDRAAAVIAAIRGQLINTLIIDEAGARAIVEAASR